MSLTEDEARIRALQRARDRAALTGTAAEAKAAELALAAELRNLRACFAASSGLPGQGGGALDRDKYPQRTGKQVGRLPSHT